MNKDYEYNGIKFTALHCDNIKVSDNLYGQKCYIAKKYCKDFPNGIVTCGSRFSTQVLMFAKTCEEFGVPCQVCIPAGKKTEMITELENTNAIINYIRPAYNSVLNARAREKAEELGYRFVALGMLEDYAFEIIANLVEQNQNIIKQHNRLVIPVGSGTILIGIVYGLKKLGIDIKVIGVMTGMDATKNIFTRFSKYTCDYDIELVKSEIEYKAQFKTDVIQDLNETYESKCLPYLCNNDLFWIVNK